jgi:hypothetical protein
MTTRRRVRRSIRFNTEVRETTEKDASIPKEKMSMWKYRSDQGGAQAVDENSSVVTALLLSSLSRIDLGNLVIGWRRNPHTRHNENMRSFYTEGTTNIRVQIYAKGSVLTCF